MKNFLISSLFFLLLFSLTPNSLISGPYSLPEPIELSQLIKECDYVARVTIDEVHHKKIKTGLLSASMEVTVKRAFKAETPLPPKIELSFIVNQRQYGKSLVSLPEKGEYILFMNRKIFLFFFGKKFESFILYEPHPFAIQNYSGELENKIIKILK
ncbi:MAG: hypothetical protein KDK36_02875 [Leptospiraceae bacterium]|nr:hypothetical protein [Leptospiraceae bacterium]